MRSAPKYMRPKSSQLRTATIRVGSNVSTRLQERTQFTIVELPMMGIRNGSCERGSWVAKYSRISPKETESLENVTICTHRR